MSIKNAILKTKIDDVIYEVMLKTGVENVYVDDTTTLAEKLSEIITSLNGKASSESVTAQISAAIDELIGGAPATYDTLKEISDYIAQHEDVVTALNQAIGNKADKSVVDAIKTKLDSIEEGANKTIVDAALSDTSTNPVQNKVVKEAIDAKPNVYFQETQPASLKNNDMWVHIV